MGVGKAVGYCIGVIIVVVIVSVILAAMWPTVIAPQLQETTDDILGVVPGFDSLAFIISLVCLFPLAMILIKRKILK